MPRLVEIKARCSNPDWIKTQLKEKNADFKGVDHQIDTYFKVPNGRLKLREGNIENTLIFYNRPNQEGPKVSEVELYKPIDPMALKRVLKAANETLVVVDKHRAIFFIENVKFHVDEVKGLGSFMEIEAIDEVGEFTKEQLLEQCQHYMRVLKVQEEDLIHHSYSDMLMV